MTESGRAFSQAFRASFVVDCKDFLQHPLPRDTLHSYSSRLSLTHTYPAPTMRLPNDLQHVSATALSQAALLTAAPPSAAARSTSTVSLPSVSHPANCGGVSVSIRRYPKCKCTVVGGGMQLRLPGGSGPPLLLFTSDPMHRTRHHGRHTRSTARASGVCGVSKLFLNQHAPTLRMQSSLASCLTERFVQPKKERGLSR